MFDELVLRDRETFRFTGRARRPPTDAMNAMLSLFYTVLAFDCASALEGVGLDPFVGFMHADRPGSTLACFGLNGGAAAGVRRSVRAFRREQPGGEFEGF